MSLDSLLTATRLRTLAGAGFQRGQTYARQGRVASCTRRGEELAGTVDGTERYAVRVFAHGNALHTSCTCPVDGVCKHAVALALHYLDGRGEPAPSAAPPTGVADPVFATTRELEAWARAHEVMHELGVSAEVLLPELTGVYDGNALRYMLARVSLRELGSLEGGARFVGVRALQRPAAAAVARRLEQAARDVQVAIAEEQTPRHAPTEPALATLWGKLVELRRVVRATASPRPRAVRAAGTLDFDRASTALVWKEPVRLALVRQTFSTASVVTRLAFTPALELSCVCQAAACTHGLALIDAACELLVDPAHLGHARQIAEEALKPPWQRALAELALHEELAAKPRAQIEVGWQIDRSLELTAFVRKALKRGGMSGGATLTAERLLGEYGDLLGEQDLRIAELAASWVPLHRTRTYPARAFAALAGHPRVTCDDEPIAVTRVPLGFTALPAGDQIRLEPSVDGARFPPRLLQPLLEAFGPGEPLCVLEPEHARCLLIDVGDEARRLWDVLARHGDAFPPESHAELLDRLARLDGKLPVVVPHALKGVQLAVDQRIVVRLRLLREGTLELEAFVRPAPGAPLFAPGAGPRDVLIQRGGERGYVRRELAGELAQVRAMLARLPLENADEGPPLCFQLHDVDSALAVVAAVQQPPPGLEAEWLDAKPMILPAPVASALRVQVDRRRDWFGIDGELKVDGGTLELAFLLDAARRQQRYVRLDDTRWIELSDQLRQRLGAIADQTFTARAHLELSPGAVPAVNALAAAGVRVEAAPAWQALTDRLAASRKLRPRPPAALAATLRPYQVEGHAWLTRLAAWGAGACLADDMGLGKTVQAIAVLLDRAKLGPALVLAPTSVTLNWVDELRRFAPSLRPVVYGEAVDRAACIAGLDKKDVLIVSYGLLVRDVEQLAQRSFATLVLDEAQALKNPATQRAKAARALDASFKIAMSGTPFENHLGELWSLFSVVFPGLLGSWEQFRTRFAVPIERDRNVDAREALSRLIRPFLLRRTKAEVATDLPARTEIHVPVALSSAEAALYENARLAAVAELAHQTEGLRDDRQRFEVLAALTRLRLLASHPRLYDATSAVASSKMQRLLELLDELRSEGHRALVFSQFTSHLALVRAELASAGIHALYLDGGTAVAERKRLIGRFQDGEGDVFLISLKAGGTGINLTAADYVIHLDPWWNPAVEDQATDRTHRIGQTKPVTVYRLISRGTVEEHILALHRDKRALVAGVLDGTDVAARLTTRDLLALLDTTTAPGAATARG